MPGNACLYHVITASCKHHTLISFSDSVLWYHLSIFRFNTFTDLIGYTLRLEQGSYVDISSLQCSQTSSSNKLQRQQSNRATVLCLCRLQKEGQIMPQPPIPGRNFMLCKFQTVFFIPIMLLAQQRKQFKKCHSGKCFNIEWQIPGGKCKIYPHC